MLSLYALVRFALSGSPFRERRELLFRRNKPNNAYEDELEAARNQEGNLDIEARRRLRQERLGSGRSVESVVSEQRLDILKSLGAVDFQRISQTITSEMAKSPEVFTTLLLQEETLRDVDVQSIAESVGIQGLTVLDKDSPNTSILQQILDKNLATSTREALVEKLLQTSPRVTAVLTRAMISRLSVYEEQMQRIESRLKILPGIPSIDRIRKIVEGNQVEAEVERMLREQGKERDKNQRRYLTGCITEAYRAYERIREFGGLYWSGARVSRVEDDAQRAEYLGNLRKQTRELNQLLGLQIQLETDKAQDHLASIAADAYARAGGEGALSEDHLENAYRPLNEPFLEIQRTQRDQQGRYRSTEDDPLFLEEQQEIFLSSELQLRRLRSGQEATEAAAARWKENPFSEVRETQEEMKQWAGRCLALIRAIKAQKTFSQHPPLIQERLGQLEEILGNTGRLEPRVATPAWQEACEQWLKNLRDRGPKGMAEFEAQTGTLEAQAGRDSADEQWAIKAARRLEYIEANVEHHTDHPICTELQIREKMQERLRVMQSQLMIARQHTGEAVTKAKTDIEVQLASFEKALATLKEFKSTPEHFIEEMPKEAFEAEFGPADGMFVRGKIVLNAGRATIPGNREATIHHESAHFILWVLTEQSGLFPDLFWDALRDIPAETSALLEAQAGKWGISYEQILKRCRETYDDPEAAERTARELFQSQLLNEAFVHRALAREGGTRVSAEEQRVFDALDAARKEPPPPAEPTEKIQASEFALFKRGDEDDEENDPLRQIARGAEGGEERKGGGSYDPTEDLETIQAAIDDIASFGATYRNFQPQVNEVLNGREGYRLLLKCLRDLYVKGETTLPDGTHFSALDPTDPNKDVGKDPRFRALVLTLKERASKTQKKCIEIEHERNDVNKAPQAKKWNINKALGIQWLCALDLARMWKELCEDIYTIWKTEQDRKTSEAMAGLTANLPVKIFGFKIPIFGKYTERLLHYTEKRRNQLELDRVKKWEDALKNEGAEDLLFYISQNPTKDQLRASIELLVGKGRMNWSYEPLWHALNRYSTYNMPIEECRRSEIVRDRWLHRLISDIWRDKDMYDEWKTGNDANYDSHKKKYTHTCDTFASIDGQLGREMKYILETYCECMHAKPKKRLPENVNPHHYEELIHYAMRNGKCTMEQKFYYLIRGIAEGLLPLDRLGVLAGQTQELLMKFPFLDYFCQRHNSMAEIKALSERITEEDNPFEPGSKTTMFLRLIMLRDKRARDRMSKAISRVAETLDHEDAPFFATEADWVTMLNLIDVISGSRGKVTVRGCQNTYVGFNEKFKIYAQLARLARDTGNPRLFKASDVRELADSIVSYTVFDNQMMRAVPLGAGPTGVKTSLSDANLQEAPISNPNLSTGEFRNRTRDFVFELAQRVGLTDQDIQGSNKKLIDSNLTLKEFLANTERDRQTVVKKEEIAAATENFARAFVEKICANPGELMSELIKREERGLFLDHTSDGLGVSTLTFKAFREKYPGVMSIAHQ